MFPCGSPRPEASNLNFAPGDVVANAVLAQVGSSGQVCIYTSATTDLVVDVNGYVPAGGSTHAATPRRLLETRPGQPTSDGLFQGIGQRGAGTVTALTVAGRGGVPADADAVMLNVTAVGPATGGYVTVFPCGSARPEASNLNFAPGDVVANAVLAQVGSSGQVCIYTSATTDLVVDVTGWT